MRNTSMPSTLGSPGQSAAPSINALQPRSAELLIGYLAMTGILTVIALAAFFVFPAFFKVFSSFGADLPLLTLLLLASGPYWGVLPLVSAVVSFDVWRRKECSRRYKIAAMSLLVCLAVLAVVIIPISAWGLYSPIFYLGQAI